MALGTKGRQSQTAETCRQHLRDKYRERAGLVEEFLREFEGTGKAQNPLRWGEFRDSKDDQAEMLGRLDEYFEKWLNP